MTDARTTQAGLEQWSQGDPAVQTTQVALEQWGSLAVGAGRAVVSQVALEQWAVVEVVAARQYAVTVIT